MGTPSRQPLAIAKLLRDDVDGIVDAWRELCKWDPMLPPHSNPPIAAALVSALADALEHPQPIGWGPDPEMEKVVGAFTLSAGSLDVAIGELVCLGESLRRRLFDRIPEDEADETHLRLEMIIDRAIGAAAQHAAARAELQTLIDSSTGLLNHHALERDLRRELARSVRYRRAVCVVVLRVVDQGAIEAFAISLREGVRAGDLSYRIGDDALAAILAEATPDAGELVAQRLVAGGAPPFTYGIAAYPEDSEDPAELLDIATQRAAT
ncbi:MAG: GGDEF domain-containing protein [Acidimicrobiia bacterium]|nr:GGDEF domain-containing protein [Acidimicrobiia bacterium]